MSKSADYPNVVRGDPNVVAQALSDAMDKGVQDYHSLLNREAELQVELAHAKRQIDKLDARIERLIEMLYKVIDNAPRY